MSAPTASHDIKTMRVVEISAPGGPEVLQVAQRPVPQPGPGEVLIAVHTAGVNRPDVLQRMGSYPPPAGHSDLPGLEASGHVVAVGADGGRFAVGDPVVALLNGGGYAQYALAEAGAVLAVPAGLSLCKAGLLAETAFTVWHNVFERGRLRERENFLVHGGTSGIGTMAIQIAKARGARVFATAGSPEKCEFCRTLGADRAINYREEDFVAAVKESGGADVILDMVGGDYIARNIKASNPDGRIVQIAFLGGAKAEINFTPLMLKRLTLTGSTLRARTPEVKAAIAHGVETHVWPLVAAGKVKPIVDSTFPLEEAGRAHARMETSAHIGKIALSLGAQ